MTNQGSYRSTLTGSGSGNNNPQNTISQNHVQNKRIAIKVMGQKKNSLAI